MAMHIPPSKNVQLSIPGDSRYLALVRMVVTTLAQAAGFPDEDVDKIEIAVDEACTNVLDHAYRDSTPKPPIYIDIQAENERFVVDIRDEGPTFDFANYQPPKFPDHWMGGKTRGLGIYLIRQCMDDTCYERFQNNNRLRLIKRLPIQDAVKA
jgi:serine/threonine-protein kinase RsbW